MKRLTLFAIAVLAASSITAQAQAQTSKLLGHEAEIDNVIRQMTLEEKIDMLHGKNMFSSAGSHDSASPTWNMPTDPSASVRRWNPIRGTLPI